MTDGPKSRISPALATALDRVRHHAQIVIGAMRQTPGGDAYEFTGSMNDVEDLREALTAVQWADYDPNAPDEEDGI